MQKPQRKFFFLFVFLCHDAPLEKVVIKILFMLSVHISGNEKVKFKAALDADENGKLKITRSTRIWRSINPFDWLAKILSI